MDLKAAYLHPKTDEEVYLEQQKAFEKQTAMATS